MDLLERMVVADTATLARVNQQLVELSPLLDSAGRYVLDLQAQLELCNEENRSLRQQAESLRREVLALSDVRSSLQAELQQKTNQALALHRESVHLQRALGDARDELERVYLSRSWRVTKPLRFFGRIFLSLKRHVQGASERPLTSGIGDFSYRPSTARAAVLSPVDVVLKGKQVYALTKLSEEVERLVGRKGSER